MKSRSTHAFAHLSLLALVLSGCAREEPTQTVSWYREHPKARKAMITRCSDDPGRLAQTPNCVNASQAEGLESIGSFRKLPPLGLDPNWKGGFDDEKATPRP